MFNILLDLKTRQGRWIKEKKPKVERMNSLENKASGTYSTAGIECKESVLQTSEGWGMKLKHTRFGQPQKPNWTKTSQTCGLG